jgi:hypothetical protein
MRRAAWAVIAAGMLAGAGAAAAKSTVCTVTVNSADEREAFRQNLPEDKYEFVELVERGRPDWLSAACRKKVQCDVLIVSGHFAGNEFYSSKFDVDESLPVDEMERAACSASCPELFSHLKEVYLFGCDSLKADPVKSAMPEIVRGLVRAGTPKVDAERFAKALSERHGEASRDRMRRVFSDVPVIYGFSSLAPYGRVAGPMLDRYFKGSDDEIGSGRASARLLSIFAPASMVVSRGQAANEPNADYRTEACRYYDDALGTADRINFMHELLGRDMPELRIAFDRIERFFATVPRDSSKPGVADALEGLASDKATRGHYLAVTRDTQDPALRVRMISLARGMGWLTIAEQNSELALTIHDVLASESMGFSEVDLVCALNRDGSLAPALNGLQLARAGARTAQQAALACLGSSADRSRVLEALASPREEDVRIAQAYLRHRPITDEKELRDVARGIVRMKSPAAQARALETLARLHVSDSEIQADLTRLFAQSPSPAVQRAIAEVFIRAGVQASTSPELAATLRRHRLKPAAGGTDLVDLLLRQLGA